LAYAHLKVPANLLNLGLNRATMNLHTKKGKTSENWRRKAKGLKSSATTMVRVARLPKKAKPAKAGGTKPRL
jgi:hypothetical protein